MILYSKEGLIFLIQVDHLNGESIGSVIDSFYEAGAKNVQIVTAVTKKNRPSYMIFVDAREKDADAIVAMKALLEEDADEEKIARALVAERCANSLNPESSIISLNLLARKADEVRNGRVTKLMIKATMPGVTKAIYEKAEYTYEQLLAGKTLAEVVKKLDDDRLNTVDDRAGEIFIGMTGEKVTVKVENLHSAARHTAKLVKKYWSFDAYADVTVTMGDKKTVMPGFVHDVIPESMPYRVFIRYLTYGHSIMPLLLLNSRAICIFSVHHKGNRHLSHILQVKC